MLEVLGIYELKSKGELKQSRLMMQTMHLSHLNYTPGQSGKTIVYWQVLQFKALAMGSYSNIRHIIECLG